MINTIITGFISISVKILDWFLQPISQYIHNSSLHDGFNTFTNNFASFMNIIKGVLPWLIDALCIPKPLFVIIMGVFLAGIVLRLSVLTIKMVVKWWDRIVA